MFSVAGVYGAVGAGLGFITGIASKAFMWSGKKVLHKLYDEKNQERTDLKPWEKTMIKAGGYALIGLGATAAGAGLTAVTITMGLAVTLALLGTGAPLSVTAGLVTIAALSAIGGILIYQQVNAAIEPPKNM